MQPVSGTDLEENIYVSGSGTVTSADKENISFIIHGTQYIDGGLSSDEIVVRGCMAGNPKWSDAAARVPDAKTVVSFDGTLQCLDTYAPAGKDAMTCLVVAVDDIQYLHSADSRSKEKSPTSHKKINLREKLRARTHANRTSQTTSSASTSQVQLGKRKAVTSEDEVDKEM